MKMPKISPDSKVREIRPPSGERPVIRLTAAETQHLLELHAQMLALQADRTGALKLLARQHGLQGSYSLSDDCLTLIPVEVTAPAPAPSPAA
jgi:hypothetical protein